MSLQFQVYQSTDDLPINEVESIFHTQEWAKLYAYDDAYEVVRCCLNDEDDKVVAMLSLLKIRLLRRVGKYGKIGIVMGEAMYVGDEENRREVIGQLVDEIERYAKKEVLVLEFRHWKDGEDVFREMGYKLLPWYNVVTGYEKYFFDVDAMISKQRMGRIKKTLGSGVKINYMPSGESWNEFYVMLKKLYRKIRRPLPNKAVFDYCLRGSDIAHCVTVERDGVVMAGAVVLVLEGEEGYLWYETIDRTIEGNENAGSIVCYAALEVAKTKYVKRFNFLGAGDRRKEYGVRNFKMSFGGKLVEEWRFRKFIL